MESKLRPYKCANCGNETEQETNHEDDFVWPCKVCSHLDEGEFVLIPSAFESTRLRKMTFIKPE